VCGLLQDVRFCPLDDQRLENTLWGEEKTKWKISNSLHVALRYSRPLHLNKIINWPSRLRSPVGLPKTSTLAALPFSNHCKLYRHFRALLLSFQLRRSAQTLLQSSGASISLCALRPHLPFAFALTIAPHTKHFSSAIMPVRTFKIGYASGQNRGRQASADSSASQNSGTVANLIEPFPAPLSPPLEKNTPPPNIPPSRYNM
jgi:hypothetical protein